MWVEAGPPSNGRSLAVQLVKERGGRFSESPSNPIPEESAALGAKPASGPEFKALIGVFTSCCSRNISQIGKSRVVLVTF